MLAATNIKLQKFDNCISDNKSTKSHLAPCDQSQSTVQLAPTCLSQLLAQTPSGPMSMLSSMWFQVRQFDQMPDLSGVGTRSTQPRQFKEKRSWLSVFCSQCFVLTL